MLDHCNTLSGYTFLDEPLPRVAQLRRLPLGYDVEPRWGDFRRKFHSTQTEKKGASVFTLSIL